ncbi:sulfotransferase domain-containing protein [Methylobacterium nodulans]|uniref:NodH sulfotransferase n=2 Tax=Methylobacterium nodulans TaxID=114616 RepID=B8ITJ7_METNO|nr:sulfotransferase domain-containing protein [Methylobacterium nodulans]ACL58913.1 NodH sulfotransferase [Methylobacterium nodulans ORS 2060]CAN84687.1 NodH protein [Methylobacterium nodulans ORS 2060]
MSRLTPPPEPFVILAMPRTGTHYLEELLNEHPNVLSNGELLNPYDMNWPDKDRLLRSDCELLELAYLRYPTRSTKAKVTHVGCKINEPQFRDRPGLFGELANWPRLKVILARRRNTLESLRSLVQARQSGQWLKFSSDNDATPPPRVNLSIADCEVYFKAADGFHDRVARSFASTDMVVIEYESLILDPNACLELIWNFLGVPALQLPGRAILQRQESRSLDQTVQNFHELRHHFAGRPYVRFFKVGDL